MAGSGARLCATVLLMLVAASLAANDTCTQDLQKLQKGTYKNAATRTFLEPRAQLVGGVWKHSDAISQ